MKWPLFTLHGTVFTSLVLSQNHIEIPSQLEIVACLHVDRLLEKNHKIRGGALGYSRYSRIPTFFQTIFNAFNMFKNPNPDKILFLSIQFHYKAGEGSLKKSMTLDIVLAVGIETS